MKGTLLRWIGIGWIVGWMACASYGKTPPDIRYGEDVCDACHMVISESRFAAALTTPDGHVYLFDDIGCMVRFVQTQNVTIQNAWVHDYTTTIWTPVETALFVRTRRVTTPMGYGVIAFATPSAARTWQSAHDGPAFSWTRLRSMALSPQRLIQEDKQ